jgi:hypothetical protein
MIRVCICTAIAAGLGAAMLLAIDGRDADSEQLLALRAKDATVRVFTNMPPAGESPALDSQTDAAPAALTATVAAKYAALLAMLPRATQMRLLQVLAAQQRTEPTNLVEIAELERQVSVLLSQSDYALYEQLREADDDRSHVQAFTRQVIETTPLTSEQQHDLLLARLKHQRERQTLALQLEDGRPEAPTMESGYARDVAVEAERHYAQTFLEDARSILNAQQWLALEKFEKSTMTATGD